MAFPDLNLYWHKVAMKPASVIDDMSVQAAPKTAASDAAWAAAKAAAFDAAWDAASAAGSYWAGCGRHEIVSGYILKAQFEGVLVGTFVGTV